MSDHNDFVKRVFGPSIRREQDKLKQMLASAPSFVPQEMLDMLQERLDTNEDTLDKIENPDEQ